MPPDPESLVLTVAACLAAALQAATGIGFGVMAGPVLLLVLDDNSAIQVSIILKLLIALPLAPALWKQADGNVVRYLFAGLAALSPLAVLVFLQLDTGMLELAAAMVVLSTLILVLEDAGERPRGPRDSRLRCRDHGRLRRHTGTRARCVAGRARLR